MAALIGLWQWLAHHWDIVTLGIVFGSCLLLLIWRDVSRGSKNPELVSSETERDTATNASEKIQDANIASILRDGDGLRIGVPRVGSPPGADHIWRTHVAQWRGRAEQFIGHHRPQSDLDKFKAYLDTSQLRVAIEHVYTDLRSEYADFSSRLEWFREMFAPGQRIAALTEEIEYLTSELASRDQRLPSVETELGNCKAALREAEGVTAAINRISNRTWELKKTARELKRRWPQCRFVEAPLDRVRWSPFIGEPETGMGGTELEKAIEWYDAFMVYATDKPNRQYPINADFDSVMAALDRDERMDRGLPQ